jgi:mono/diheme cytochrome c family protein
MLRESRARWLAIATVIVVVLLAALFAGLRNRTDVDVPSTAGRAGATTPAAPGAPFDRAAALAAYERLNCTACHVFEGRGSGAPLDRVGGRLSVTSIRDYALGEGSARGALPAGIVQMKQRVARDPEIDAVVTLLAQSK